MYPTSLEQYTPTESERIVYNELKKQLTDEYSVFYSVSWSRLKDGRQIKSEADFIVVSERYGFLCLEVKGGSSYRVENNTWFIADNVHGERRLNKTPHEQAEESMYYLENSFLRTYNTNYNGFYGAAVVFPFYTINDVERVTNRPASYTIDYSKMNDLSNCIKNIFKIAGGKRFGRSYYRKEEHALLLEIIRKNIAGKAAAGALVRYKNKQFSVINRVQNNYIYFIDQFRQFYIRGGAGTGKTWIGMKLAKKYFEIGERVLILCSSPELAKWLKSNLNDAIDVYSFVEFLQIILEDKINGLKAPMFEGILDLFPNDLPKYDAIIIDEAQDFNEEWACISRLSLKDEENSHLVVLYDDVQCIREESFGDAFMIKCSPFLLRENIRNTENIYKWATKKTRLGEDVITNPIEGPIPVLEEVRDEKHLIQRLESILKEFLVDEVLSKDSLVILVDDFSVHNFISEGAIASWKFEHKCFSNENYLAVSTVSEFKGLEANMVIYIHRHGTSKNINYIAYTRARYFLYEFVCNY